MRKAKVLTDIDESLTRPIKLDDFSRFKEKLIKINTLKALQLETNKAVLKDVAERIGSKTSAKDLKNALDEIIKSAIQRIER